MGDRDVGSRDGRFGHRRRRDDSGGVWIVTGIVLGVLLYAGIVLMAVAGFTEVAPLVVVPPVLLVLIAGGNLLGAGRGHGRSAGRAVGPGRAPMSSNGPNDPLRRAAGSPGNGGQATEEPPGPA